ncbi:MAG: GntR family transcriptional regulator [Acidimicrobiales bacterium]
MDWASTVAWSSDGEDAVERHRTAHELVRDVLRRGILSGVVVAGNRLIQSQIADQLQVSTTPVREALRELASEGLVRFDAHRGAVVRELSRAELEELYELRKLLEPVAIQAAARDASRTTMLQAVQVVAAMETETDSLRWADMNSSFHRILEESGGGPRLASILKNLRELSAVYVAHSVLLEPDRIRYGNVEHEEILSAVIARDSEAAAEAVHRHLCGTLNSLLRVRQIGDHSGAAAHARRHARRGG